MGRAERRPWLMTFMGGMFPSVQLAAHKITDSLVKHFAPRSATTRRYTSCAVVGSGPRLRGSGLGRVIDSHAAVFRFNQAVTERVEAHVGSRTTHRFVNRHTWKPEWPAREGETFVHLSD